MMRPLARIVFLGILTLLATVLAIACGSGRKSSPLSRPAPITTSPTPRAAATGAAATTTLPFVRADCEKFAFPVVDERQFCDVSERLIRDINDFWKGEFPKLRSGAVYVSPSRIPSYGGSGAPPLGIDAGCLTDVSGPAMYCRPDSTISLNQSELPFIFRLLKNNGVATVIAHEWGHHIEALSGQLPGPSGFTIQAELEADCYAGLYSKYAQEVSHVLGPEDLRQGALAFYDYRSDRSLQWYQRGSHGEVIQRTLAFLVGARFGDPAICAPWKDYLGEPVLEVGKYQLALYPGTGNQRESGTIVLTRPEARAEVRWFPDLPAQPASSQLASVSRSWQGPNARLLDSVRPPEKLGGTSAAQRYEQSVGAKTVHGVLYLLIHRDGGGIAIDIYADGPASGADWKPLDTFLRTLLLGLQQND